MKKTKKKYVEYVFSLLSSVWSCMALCHCLNTAYVVDGRFDSYIIDFSLCVEIFFSPTDPPVGVVGDWSGWMWKWQPAFVCHCLCPRVLYCLLSHIITLPGPPGEAEKWCQAEASTWGITDRTFGQSLHWDRKKKGIILQLKCYYNIITIILSKTN